MTMSVTPKQPAVAATSPFLVVIEEQSSWRFTLPASGVVTIGRVAGCEVALSDPTASRRHAQLRIADGEIHVSDLGSYNGTMVNGEVVVGERELRSGDLIQICATSLSFHRPERRSEPRVVVDEATLHQRLGLELERARRFQRPLTVIALRFEDGVVARVAAANALAAAVRAVDIVGTDGAAGLLVLAPELPADEAPAVALRIAAVAAAWSPHVGVATCPHDAVDSATLLATARAAASSAPAGEAITASAAARRLDLDGVRVLVAEPAMARLFALIERVAASDLPILVHGETGAGKESGARAVDHFSRRRGGPLVSINCAAIPDGLVESELFGHEKGAFSGATAAKVGLFEAASGGTVFLDEIGELPLGTQSKLLRALDGHKITRVGSVVERAIDVRIVAATNRELQAEVKAGRFREDLYFRLGGATVSVPPLRERPRDLPLLARELLDAARARLEREPVGLSSTAMHVLAQHRWPGNVRELKNAMEYAAAVVDTDDVEAWHLPPSLVGEAEPEAPAAAAGADTDAPVTPTPAAGVPRGFQSFRPIAEELRALERKRMVQALEVAGGVQTRAAELLRMPRRTFVAKMKEYELGAKPDR
jgi:DNA-binding NtrC family response regulator